MRIVFLIFCVLSMVTGSAQTLGGNAAYNFLKLPSTPLLTAVGGANVSYQAGEAGLAANNPALLHPSLHGQLGIAFNSFFSGIKTYSLSGVYDFHQRHTMLGGQIYFVDYGAIPQTDASGNESGSFRPVDFVVQASAARSYLDRWHYGFTLKFIHSAYSSYRSSAIAVDAGIHYQDSAHGFQAGFIARNMGAQLKTYAGEREDLPFDLQIGITKKLARAPFAFSVTAGQLHRFNLLYNDTVFNNENEFSSGKGFVHKLLNHFVIATHIFLGNQLEVSLGYNHLRRSELNIADGGNGLNGFSVGLRLKFSKLQVMYSRASYQKNIAYNQLGITLALNRLFGLGQAL